MSPQREADALRADLDRVLQGVRENRERLASVVVAPPRKVQSAVRRVVSARSATLPLVMIVEDDPMTSSAYTRVFAEHHRVTLATRISEARQILDRCVPAVAIVDLMLPDGNGAVLVHEIREVSEITRIVIVTGLEEATARADLVHAGVDPESVEIVLKAATDEAAVLLGAVRGRGRASR